MKEYIPGGKAEGMDLQGIADKHGVTLDIIEREHKAGIKIEHEHTPDANVAGEIAKDHLFEFPTYYTFLEEMESKAKKDYKAKGYAKKKAEKDRQGPDPVVIKDERLKKLFG
jgi:hypothetical protein